METGIVAAEIAAIDYGEMGPPVHDAVEHILSERSGASVWIDNIGISTLEVIRGIFRANQGNRLPDYHYNEKGEYVQMGQTPVIEERHTRIMAIDRGDQNDSLWVRVPERSAAPVSPESAEATDLSFREALRTIRTDLALGALCLVADGTAFYGMYTGKLTTVTAILGSAGFAGGAGVSIDAARRLLSPASPA